MDFIDNNLLRMKGIVKIVVVLYVFVIFFSCGDNQDSVSNNSQNSSMVPFISYSIMNVYLHDTSAFTQGLQFYKGKLYESTGDYQNSSLRIVDLKTGNVLEKNSMGSNDLFAEGITIFNDKIFQLTWKNHIVFVYSLKNIYKVVKKFSWSKEGWGITNDGNHLIVSDGSSFLYFVDPETFQITRKLEVLNNNLLVEGINELEFIRGYIYANVFEKNIIIKIDPSNGNVVGIIDFSSLKLLNDLRFINSPEKVLNGIAYDSLSNKVFITGKNWPIIFELDLSL